MTKKIKEFTLFTCIINHDSNKKILFIDYLRKGKLFYILTITNLKKTTLRKFLSAFSEEDAKDLLRNNIEFL